jgi:hypothetical protein
MLRDAADLDRIWSGTLAMANTAALWGLVRSRGLSRHHISRVYPCLRKYPVTRMGRVQRSSLDTVCAWEMQRCGYIGGVAPRDARCGN